MLFYPLWVHFWQFSWEPSVPPLPVGVDKGWLKPRRGACIEHMLAHVYHSVWRVHCEWTNVVNRCCILYKVFKIPFIRKPSSAYILCFSFSFFFSCIPNLLIARPPVFLSQPCPPLSSCPFYCPAVSLFLPLLHRFGFFVSESWPPSCQLRQD